MLTLQITQEEIDVTTRICHPKLDNLDYFFEIVPSDVHGRDAPM